MRAAMVASQLRTNAVTDLALLDALGRVPREKFVPAERGTTAYIDRAVPLGGGRALNPPMTTALLLDAAEIGPDSRVLIVGAATGYAPALAASMAADVTGVESDAALAAQAKSNISGVRLVEGPLENGAAAHAPYDAIVIDGAVEFVPEALVAQLALTGRLTAAILENGVAHLAVGRRGGSGFALSTFVDAESVVLPGFVRPREFVF
ncbi:protein-L-isoaspartate O-methyltransferase [Sphingomonas sp. SUN039]|nr:protein-L-isoaspartate O-methyltransferase [Sphingomonas sp. SUN039]